MSTPTRMNISRPGLLRVYAWVLITASITVLALHGVNRKRSGACTGQCL